MQTHVSRRVDHGGAQTGIGGDFTDIRAFSFVNAALNSCLQDLLPLIVISIDDAGSPEARWDLVYRVGVALVGRRGRPVRWLNGSDVPIMSNPNFAPNFLCYKRVLKAPGVPFNEDTERERFKRVNAENREWRETGFDDVLMSLKEEDVGCLDLFDDVVNKANDADWTDVINRLPERFWATVSRARS